MRLIETTNLQRWADSKQSETRLPKLIKQLIWATVPPAKVCFPSEDSIWMPGFDGVVRNDDQQEGYVPRGISFWEVSVQKTITTKANSDYSKRKEQCTKDGIDLSEITFVFVTPYCWKQKTKWETKKKEDGIWKNVIALDGVDLADWLEKALAVQIRFAEELGIISPYSLQLPETAWEEWRLRFEKPLSEELVTAGRESKKEELLHRLKGAPDIIVVESDSPQESFGFVLACLNDIESGETKDYLLAKTIVAKKTDFSCYGDVKNSIFLFEYLREIPSRYPLRHGNHLIISKGRVLSGVNNSSIKLRRADRGDFANSLHQMGYTEEKASELARKCNRSITALQSIIPCCHGTLPQPQWKQDPEIINLLPALLAGRWDEQNENDRKVLCDLAGKGSYSYIQSPLNRFYSCFEDSFPPLDRIGSTWSITAPIVLFQLIGNLLTDDYLDRFKNVFRNILGQIDPRIDNYADGNFYEDPSKSHSKLLRYGISETGLLLFECRECLQQVFPQPDSAQRYLNDLVRGLPGLNDDWRLLVSLRDQYATLIEAAPDPLLDSLEQLLEAKPEGTSLLFRETGILGIEAFHTGLLWGLETLAWSPDYLPRVSLILAKLAQLDPGGHMINRPINSLWEIFLWWHPGTNASTKQRLEILESILAKFPQVGMELLLKLLPSQHEMSSGTSKPQWRDFGDIPKESLTRKGAREYANKIVDLALSHLAASTEQWRVILESLFMFSSEHQEKTFEVLVRISESDLSPDIRKQLWDVLRDFTNRHRTHSNTDWALPAQHLNRLDDIASTMRPNDLVENNKWLFDEWLPDIPEATDDFEKHEAKVCELRKQAIKDILKANGSDGIIRLALTCKIPNSVSGLAVSALGDFDKVIDLIDKVLAVEETGEMFARYLSQSTQMLFKEPYKKILESRGPNNAWSNHQVANLLLLWPDERATWDFAESFGKDVAETYWTQKPVYVFRENPEEHSYYIKKNIEVGRAVDAFDMYCLHLKGVPTEDLLKLFDAMFSELSQIDDVEKFRNLRIDSYHIHEFLKHLRTRDDISPEEIARREYQALPLLSYREVKDLTLHEFMATDPEFFVQILCNAYKPHSETSDKRKEISKEEQNIAMVSFSLLNGMERLPGCTDPNKPDKEGILLWINKVRERASEADRTYAADHTIGKILAHAPPDEDNNWPHPVIGELIENLAVTEIEQGLMLERVNMRGIYEKALGEGGEQERELAQQYREWSNNMLSRCPRIARVLESIAKNWERHAREEDNEADIMRKFDL